MDRHRRHSSSLCKRKRNRIPLNLVSTKKGSKKRRLKITKEIVDVPLSSHNVVTTDSPWPNDESEPYQEDVIDDTSSVSAHMKRKQKLSEKWDALRSDAYQVMIQAHALFPNQSCFTCSSENANVRCEQCGLALYMCSNCCINIHSQSHHHHFPEIWQDNSFIPFKLPTSTVWISDHECASKFLRSITCFHIEGIPYRLNVQFCKCVPDALRLIKLGYWPATPTRPVLAFTHSFMEWMEALLLECQVSVQDFSSAVEMIIKEKFRKMPCNIYPVLIDTFEEFRNLKEELRHLKGIVEKDLFKCPACPKEQGKLTLSIDANFGLCRKKAAGNSVHEPLSGTMMFFDQDDVDRFIADYGSSLGISSDCSEFLAGHALRSRSRFAALSETAIMGAVCRHEFPLCFINLFHGERMSYCMYILEQLKTMFPNQEVQVMYDVACVLTKHLKAKKRDDLLSKFSFAVPVFHAYGHTTECQISMNPRNMEGFNTMTKEMRPAHRIDVLTHGLSYYGRCAAEHIGLLLCKRMDNAVNTLSEAKKNLQILLKESPEPVTNTNIVAWAREAKIRLANESTVTTRDPPPTWQEMYVTHLDTLQTIRNALQQSVGDNASVQTLTCNLIKTEMLLQKTEESHNLVRRWTPNCQEFVATKDIMKSNLRKKLKSKIRCYARERWFLLRLKSKYADGQKIAIRLSRRIAVVSKLLKKSLALYNSGIDASCHLLWNEAIGLSSEIYQDCLFDESSVPTVVKYQAVQLHHQICRSEEEIERIKTEMCDCVNHYIDVYEYLLKHAKIYEQSEHPLHLCDLGKLCLLKKAMKKCTYQLQSLQCFLQHTELEQLQSVLTSLSGQLEHEEQYVPDQDDIEQGIHSNENMCADHDTDLDQNFAASNQGASINKFSVVNPMSNSTNPSPATVLLQDYDSVSDVGLDSVTNISRDSGSSVATLLNNVYHAEIADTNDVIIQSPIAAESAANNIVNQEDNLHSDTNKEQDLFTVGPRSLFLHSEETYDVIKRFSTTVSNQVTDTESHESVTESSSEESDEEMVVQDWRINRFSRETYLDSIRNVDDDLSKLLTDLEQSAKVKITQREKVSTIKPVSYLNIPREVLEKSIKQFELAEKRAEKLERLQKLPVFQIK